MTWNNDGNGLLVRSNEIKGYLPSHSWAMKLSQLHKQPDKQVRISTYSMTAEYVVSILGRRPHHIRLMCHQKFSAEVERLSSMLPDIEVQAVNDLHAKMVLIEPDTVYVGSANFVASFLKDCTIGVRSRALHDHYAPLFDDWWNRAE